MVLLVVTSRIEKALKEVEKLDKGDSEKREDDDESELAGSSVSSPPPTSISHSHLIEISKRLSSTYPDSYHLSDLIKGTSIYIPPKPTPPPKSKQFLEQMERLRNEEAEREYQQMINPEMKSLSTSEPIPTLSQETKELKEQLSAIVNILVSVGSVAAAVWYWTGSSAGYSITTRTLLTLFGALTILVAEVFIYIRYKIKIDDAKVVEINKKEKKVVISSSELGGKGEKIEKEKNQTIRKRKSKKL